MSATIRSCAALTLAAAFVGEFARPSVVLAPAPAQKAKPAKVAFQPFVGTLEAARLSAAERNVPLLIHIVLEGEAQNDEYRDKILPDVELQQLCERAVVIVSNNGEHPQTTVKEEVDGNVFERPACSVYRFFSSCNEHRETWDPLYFEYHEENGDMRCPQTVLLDPAGQLAWRFNTANPPPVGDVSSALKDAQKAAGPGLTLAELTHVKSLVAQGRKRTLDADHAGAWRSWNEIAQVVSGGSYGLEAKAGIEAALAALRAEVQTARALLVPGQAARGYALLVALDTSCAGTPLAREVKDALKQAEKDKAIKGEIELHKLELEAQALWDEAQAFLAEKQERKAEGSIKRLLRKKYRATQAAATARAKYPEWAAEADAAGK